ncbi:MAG: ligand-gated channel [Novosphingobium sp.]|nr:ligand-gated channel [Novosphingobium sp.]
MFKYSDGKYVLLASAIALSFPGLALAQEAAPQGGDGEFLGTIDIGESARAIATDTAAPVTVINRKEIEERQANTIAELLDSIPGVTLINGGTPIGSGINIRGFGANGTYGTDQKVLVMVDGATTGSQELYRIGTQLFTDPLLYKSATVNRGTVGSFEYGSGVIGGVVRLETSDASDLLHGKTEYTVAQSVNGQTNSAGFSTSTTVAAMPNEHFEFLGNYTWRELGTQKDGNGNVIGNSAFGLPSFLLKGALHFGADNAHTIKASYTKTRTSERDKPYDSFGTTGGAFGNVDRETNSQTLTVGYYYKPVANDAVDLSLVYSYARQDIQQESTIQPTPPGFDVISADHRYETAKITLRNASLFSTGSIRHNLRVGLEYIDIKRLSANSAPGGTDRRMAAFLVDDITVARGLTVTPAVRWETSNIKGLNATNKPVSYNNEAWMGGISARYEAPFGLAVFGSWATTKSLPILDDLFTPAYMTLPERGKTWEVGGSFNRVSLLAENDRLAIKVNYYDTDLLDNTSYSGVKEVYLNGWEIEASYAMPSGFYVDFNGNIVRGLRLRTNNVIDDWTNLPNNTYQVSVGKRFGTLFDVRREATYAENLVTRTGATNGTFTSVTKEGFNVHSLRASFTPKVDNFRTLAFRVSVENLFDTFYVPGLATRPAPGRTLKGGITVQF